jgi:hypothetical protein
MVVYRLYLRHTRELYLETTSLIDLEATGQRLDALCVKYYIES